MAIAAAASGAVAQATSDTVPYTILAGVCLVALTALPLAAPQPRPQPAPPARDTRPLEYAA